MAKDHKCIGFTSYKNKDVCVSCGAVKYPDKKVTLTFNNIFSKHRPKNQRMLFILVALDLYTGTYEAGRWFDINGDEIEAHEVTAWAYYKVPDFE